MRRIGQFFAAPGVISEQMTIFLAQGLRRGTATPEPDERIRPAILSMPEALRKIQSGAICDAKSITKSIIGVLLAFDDLKGSKKLCRLT